MKPEETLKHLKLWLEDNVQMGTDIVFDDVGIVKSADVLAALEALVPDKSAMHYTIVTGSPVDGFQFYGVFPERNQAVIEAEAAFDKENWWIAVVCPLEIGE